MQFVVPYVQSGEKERDFYRIKMIMLEIFNTKKFSQQKMFT